MAEMHSPSQRSILMADDDEDDRELARDAFHEAGLTGDIEFAIDGQQLLERLRESASSGDVNRPDLILLDLNMPRLNGREALAAIRGDTDLRDIPVVVLTTSRDVEDIRASYRLGASSFIVKPVNHAALTAMMRGLGEYWFGLVELPG